MVPLIKPRLNPSEDDIGERVITTSDNCRTVWFPKGQTRCPVYERQDLKSGFTLEGPAIIQEREATTLVEAQWTLQVDQFGNLVIEKN
jgi:N-methylhydantoinase A/oxoprolinase/acetone carboxylase beta subunit